MAKRTVLSSMARAVTKKLAGRQVATIHRKGILALGCCCTRTGSAVVESAILIGRRKEPQILDPLLLFVEGGQLLRRRPFCAGTICCATSSCVEVFFYVVHA